MSEAALMFQPLKKYADFSGRARRSEFWLWVLFRYLVGMALGTVMSTVMFSNMASVFSNPNPDPQVFFHQYFSTFGMMMPLIGLVDLALLIPSLAVGVRRLHDIGRTGWWLIMPFVVLAVGLVVFFIIFGTQIFSLAGNGKNMTDAQGEQFALTMIGSMFLCVLLPYLIAWIVMLVFYVTESKRGPNRFGPDPKGEALNNTP